MFWGLMLGLVLGIVLAILCYDNGMRVGENRIRAEVVEEGYAYWDFDPETNEVLFVWRDMTKEQEAQ